MTSKSNAKSQPVAVCLFHGEVGEDLTKAARNPMVKRIETALRKAGKQAHLCTSTGFRSARAHGCRVALFVFLDEKYGRDMLLGMGRAALNGLEVRVVSDVPLNQPPSPCRMRPADERNKASLDYLAGKWSRFHGGMEWLWTERTWTPEELAMTPVTFGKALMYKPKDYRGMWDRDGKSRLIWPADCEWPHELDLAAGNTRGAEIPLQVARTDGFMLCEVPLKTLDYWLGQNWLFGEYRQKVQQWAWHVRHELDEAWANKSNDWSEFLPGAYWDAAGKLVMNGTSQKPARPKEFCYGKPTWIAVRDRWGNVQDPDPTPDNWTTSHWDIEDRDAVQEDNREDDDAYELDDLSDAEREQQRADRSYRLADILGEYVGRKRAKIELEGHQKKAAVVRHPDDPDLLEGYTVCVARWIAAVKPEPWMLKRAREQQERRAWQAALRIQDGYERLRIQADECWLRGDGEWRGRITEQLAKLDEQWADAELRTTVAGLVKTVDEARKAAHDALTCDSDARLRAGLLASAIQDDPDLLAEALLVAPNLVKLANRLWPEEVNLTEDDLQGLTEYESLIAQPV